MDNNQYINANQIAWDEVAPIHAQQRFDKLAEAFKQPGFLYLTPMLTEQLHALNVAGKVVAQLCCNNGRELLSIKNLGAARCVGFDISREFIKQATMLANIANLQCEFVHSDVYKIPGEYDNTFDLIYISVGSLCWMPDLDDFFHIVARLLKPGGQMFICDMHPFLWMFAEEDHNDPPALAFSYFNSQPSKSMVGLDYYGMSVYQASPSYWFHHKLSDIINGCIRQQLTIKKMVEFEQDVSGAFPHFEKIKYRLPLGYYLVAGF